MFGDFKSFTLLWFCEVLYGITKWEHVIAVKVPLLSSEISTLAHEALSGHRLLSSIMFWSRVPQVTWCRDYMHEGWFRLSKSDHIPPRLPMLLGEAVLWGVRRCLLPFKWERQWGWLRIGGRERNKYRKGRDDRQGKGGFCKRKIVSYSASFG